MDRSALQRVLQCIIADFGLTAPPMAGCPPRSGDGERDRIAHIAQGVVEQLRQRGLL